MAKATKHSTTRRRLPAEHMALIADMRRLAAEHYAAVMYEMNLECSREDRVGWRKYKDAIAVSEAAYERLKALTRKVLARPVESWADVAVLAELAKVHDAETGKVTDPDSGEVAYVDLPHEVLAAVLDGALQLSGSSAARGFVCGNAAEIYPPSVLT